MKLGPALRLRVDRQVGAAVLRLLVSFVLYTDDLPALLRVRIGLRKRNATPGMRERRSLLIDVAQSSLQRAQ